MYLTCDICNWSGLDTELVLVNPDGELVRVANGKFCPDCLAEFNDEKNGNLDYRLETIK